MKPENPLTNMRLKLKTLGYDVIPLREAKLPFKDWPKQPNTEADIRQWWGCATGVRLYGKACLFAIDLDIRIAAVRDEILAAYKARWPEFLRGCLPRHSGAVTLMLIGRCITSKGLRQSGRWHSDASDEKGNLVEIFTSNCKRQIAVQGVHSGRRRYGYYGGRAIWDTPLTSLPWFPDADIDVAITIADEIMARHGLQQSVARAKGGGGSACEKVYDLEPHMLITLSDGAVMALEDLEQIAGTERITAYATLWDETSTTSDRVLVNKSSTGLMLWDSKTGISHRWKHRGRAAEFEDFKALIREMMTPEVLS